MNRTLSFRDGWMVICAAICFGIGQSCSAGPQAVGCQACEETPPKTDWVVTGFVRQEKTGAPVEEVAVVADGPEGRFSTRSEADGSYLLHGPRGGHYVISVRRGISEIPVIKPVTYFLNPGRRMESNFTVRDGAIISGRIRDSEGQPVPNAYPAVFTFRRSQGRISLSQVWTEQMERLQNENYRVRGLAPGLLVLAAVRPGTEAKILPARPEDLGAPPSQAVAFVTFYPNIADPEASSPLRLEPDIERTGLDFVLKKEPAHCVQFQLGKAPGQNQTSEGEMFLLQGLGGKALTVSYRQHIPLGSWVESCGVTRGAYELLLLSGPEKRARDDLSSTRLSRIPLTVGDKNLNLGEVVPGTAAPWEVRARIAGKGDEVKWPGLEMLLTPNRFWIHGETRSAKVDADGVFRFRQLFPDWFSWKLTGLPPGYYIDSARQDGRDVKGSTIVPTSPLDITLRTDGPVISGTVLTDKQAPVADALVFVESTEGVRCTTTDQAGNYAIHPSVPPGEVSLVAVTGVWANQCDELSGELSNLKKDKFTASAGGAFSRTLTAVSMNH